MFSINMEDVYKMLETMRGQLIVFHVEPHVWFGQTDSANY